LENLQPRVDSVQARQIDAEALAIDGDPVLLVQFGTRDFGDSCLVSAKWNMFFRHDCHVNTHFCAVFVDLSSFQKLGVVKFSQSSSL